MFILFVCFLVFCCCCCCCFFGGCCFFFSFFFFLLFLINFFKVLNIAKQFIIQYHSSTSTAIFKNQKKSNKSPQKFIVVFFHKVCFILKGIPCIPLDWFIEFVQIHTTVCHFKIWVSVRLTSKMADSLLSVQTSSTVCHFNISFL